MSDWYVYQHDGAHFGPWSTEHIAQEILAGRLSSEVWVAAPGGPRWLRALDVPAISRVTSGALTPRRRRDSGLRIVPGAFTQTALNQPSFGSTVMMVRDDELDFDGDAKPTDRGLPPTPGPTLATSGRK